jgi:hypothetical protein
VDNKHNPKKPLILENVGIIGTDMTFLFDGIDYNYTLNNDECFNVCLETMNCAASQFKYNWCFLFDKNFEMVYNPNETSYLGNSLNNTF